MNNNGRNVIAGAKLLIAIVSVPQCSQFVHFVQLLFGLELQPIAVIIQLANLIRRALSQLVPKFFFVSTENNFLYTNCTFFSVL